MSSEIAPRRIARAGALMKGIEILVGGAPIDLGYTADCQLANLDSTYVSIYFVVLLFFLRHIKGSKSNRYRPSEQGRYK